MNKQLQLAKNDTTKLRLLVDLSELSELDDMLKYTLPAIEIANKCLDNEDFSNRENRIKALKALALNNTGFVYDNKGDITKALDYYNESLTMFLELGDKTSIANTYYNIGGVYRNRGDIKKALDCWSNSLKIYEEIGDNTGIGRCLNNIGSIYEDQKDLVNTLKYYHKSLKLFKETGYKQGEGIGLNNLGLIYQQNKQFDKALEYYFESLKILEAIGEKNGAANTLHNLGGTYRDLADFPKSLEYYFKSLVLHKQIGDLEGVTNSLNNIGGVYNRLAFEAKKIGKPAIEQKNYLLSRAYLDSALTLSKKIGYPNNIMNAEKSLTDLEFGHKNFKASFEHYKQYIIYRDSLLNLETQKASLKSQLKYEFEKKEAVIKEQQDKERAVAREKDSFQKIIIASVALGLLLVMIFAAFIFRSLKTTRKQKIIIEEKQKEILDSIRYAKRIQQSLLPTNSYITNSLNKLRKN